MLHVAIVDIMSFKMDVRLICIRKYTIVFKYVFTSWHCYSYNRVMLCKKVLRKDLPMEYIVKFGHYLWKNFNYLIWVIDTLCVWARN